MNKQKWIECALANGFESFQIRTASVTNRKLGWFGGQADSFVTSSTDLYVMRGLCGGKMAVFSADAPDDSEMEQVIRSMKEMAAVITSDDREFIRKPEPTEEVKSSRVWVRPESAEVISLLEDLEKRILAFDPRIVQVIHLEWSDGNVAGQIVNSYGMDISDDTRAQILVAGAAASDGTDVKNGYKVEVVGDLSSFDRDAFVRELCSEILAKIGAKSMPSGNYPVIMEKEAMTDLFSAFSDMFSGELVGKGISPLRDKLGEKIFSPLVTVVDDPREDAMMGISNYDDEGCPTRRKVLVENGVLKQILHHSKSAARMDTESTGNGFSGSVSPMGCCIVPGTKTLEELCADMGNGLVVTELQGLHAGLDHVTADFSLQCQGYIVENGRRSRSVSLITVAGNFLDLMKHVTAVASDLDWKYYTVAAPSIAFESIAVSGE